MRKSLPKAGKIDLFEDGITSCSQKSISGDSLFAMASDVAFCSNLKEHVSTFCMQLQQCLTFNLVELKPCTKNFPDHSFLQKILLPADRKCLKFFTVAEIF